MSNQEEIKKQMTSQVNEIIGDYVPEEDSIVIFVVKSEGEQNKLRAVTNVGANHITSMESGYQRFISDYILQLSQLDLYTAMSVTEDLIAIRHEEQFQSIVENTDPEATMFKHVLVGILQSKMKSIQDNL